ncbi:DEAD/DEAH box helicase [Thermomicrobium sp. 4228-Ro]|uniref:DEAD/DEAH box helicase n=1 Tax=Thermomicrobium sp. 4228-Ro TaxID=2993937 RepID=UPI002249151D|nr:DEAD/DEAH box helicase [Thermomicrobium sp. 4228-Ro]MCX2727448.1 DEAD/DEAH box helicase [Thermomicrobium sp. 4228-Ro]
MVGREMLPRVYDAFFGTFGRLRPVQERAIPLVLQRQNLLIIAPTGSGKTEAVVAPLVEMALDHPQSTFALYIAPTRALVNDLAVRLSERLSACGLRLAVRHGESKTVQGRDAPAMILTTPESLEVMLAGSDDYVTARLREVQAVVIDETHLFYGTPRGVQLGCLLERLKQYTRHPLQRLCLSATVAEPELVAAFFRGSDAPFRIISVPGVRDLVVHLDVLESDSVERLADITAYWLTEILERHRKVLVFANTRVHCDWLAWKLSERVRNVPVLLHYSSLHGTYRKHVERTFREASRGVCIATSTLELGIDIGDIDAVAMWGAPNTVTSFLQRIGRGNRRSGTCIVYAGCPAFYPSGRDADPTSHALTFAALTHCAVHGVLESVSVPRHYSVLVQQLLALCHRWGAVAADGFFRVVERPPAFATLETLAAILDGLAQAGVLEFDSRRQLWWPTDRFHRLWETGLFWGNIPEQVESLVLRKRGERDLPIAGLPREYSRGLRPGNIVVVAGKPRLVLEVKETIVRVRDLEVNEAQFVRYSTPPEPTSATVARAIADVLTMTDAELARLPIRYTEAARERLRRCRSVLQPLLATREMVAPEPDGRWVAYTFAGTNANRLLELWLQKHGTRVLDADAWRVWCASEPPLHVLARCTADALASRVRSEWKRFVRMVPLPPAYRFLPEELKQEELISVLDLETCARLLQALLDSTARTGVTHER